MPGVLVKIRSLYHSLPKAERNVADYILQNAERAPHRSVHEFAKAGSVSVASVSRFVRKLGFAGFKDFKLELARDTTVAVRSTGSFSYTSRSSSAMRSGGRPLVRLSVFISEALVLICS